MPRACAALFSWSTFPKPGHDPPVCKPPGQGWPRAAACRGTELGLSGWGRGTTCPDWRPPEVWVEPEGVGWGHSYSSPIHTPAPALQVSSVLGVKAFQMINRNTQTVLPKVKNENSPLHLVLTATRSCFPCSSTFPAPLAYLLYRDGFPDQPEIWIPTVT